MKTKYEIINEIHTEAHELGDAELLKSIPELLESWNIRLRADDGRLYQINISHPENGILVVGLRYLKKDKTLTEDIIEFNSLSPNDEVKYYKGRYEKVRNEYKGTHKQQNVSKSFFTSANTCSFFVGNK